MLPGQSRLTAYFSTILARFRSRAFMLSLAMVSVLGVILIREREAESGEQGLCLLIGVGRGNERDVHSLDLGHLVDVACRGPKGCDAKGSRREDRKDHVRHLGEPRRTIAEP